MTSFSPVNSDGCLSPVSQQHTQQLSLEDFELIKVIGKGGFSKVFQGNIIQPFTIMHLDSEEEGHRKAVCDEDLKQGEDQERQQGGEHPE